MATILDNISVSGEGVANISTLESVHIEISGVASVEILVSKDNSIFDSIATIASSGFYVPNVIPDNLYVKAIATITSGNVTVIV
jgi:hypothetical protein